MNGGISRGATKKKMYPQKGIPQMRFLKIQLTEKNQPELF